MTLKLILLSGVLAMQILFAWQTTDRRQAFLIAQHRQQRVRVPAGHSSGPAVATSASFIVPPYLAQIRRRVSYFTVGCDIVTRGGGGEGKRELSDQYRSSFIIRTTRVLPGCIAIKVVVVVKESGRRRI